MVRLLRRSAALAAVLSATLPAAAGAAWPGGNGMIAFVCGGICVVNADGTGLVQMPFPENGMGGAAHPSWSPDGNRLVFSASTADTFPFSDIYSVKADGTDLRRLTTNPATDWTPSYTADGSRILFASPRPGGHIYSMAPDGSDEREIVHAGSNYDAAPRMNPAGTRILFERNLASEGIELWSMAPNGSDVQFVTGGQVADWAPNGSRITWPSRGTSGFDEIWTMAPNGSDQQPLYEPTSYESEVFNPSYSPDGRFVVSTRSIATDSIPGTALPLLWVTEVANPANHRGIWPNPAAPSTFDNFGYVFDAVWQPCIPNVTTTCRTVAPPAGGGGGGGGGGGAPTPNPPPPVGGGTTLLPKTAGAISVKRRQRGARVKLSVKIAVTPASLEIRATAAGKSVGRKVVPVRSAGTKRLTLKLNARGRRTLRQTGLLKLRITLRATSPTGRTTSATKRVTLSRG